MHRFKFTPDDLFINRLKTYPEYNVFIYQGRMHVNRESRPNDQLQSGGLVVYDINRAVQQNLPRKPVIPFVVSGSKKVAFKRFKYQPLIQNHSGDFQWGASYVNGVATEFVTTASSTNYQSLPFRALDGEFVLDGLYGTESPIKRNLTSTETGYTANYFNFFTAQTVSSSVSFSLATNLTASALNNLARKYTTLSPHFIFSASTSAEQTYVNQFLGGRNLLHDNNDINFITIPSMYYGSTIKKGSVELNYYITGSKIASCADINHNGTLIGTTGSTSGSVVGLVMYDEGIIMLTSSTNLETGAALGIRYNGNTNPTQLSSWQYFGTTLHDEIDIASTNLEDTSFDLNFKGVNYVNSMTMFAHARKGHLNHSNNPTYRKFEKARVNETGSGQIFAEGPAHIVNIVSGSHISASFDKTTYISKVHIYDEAGNLIGITSLAKPIKKTIEDEFTLKMKLDL